jgi:hypothetical protein
MTKLQHAIVDKCYSVSSKINNEENYDIWFARFYSVTRFMLSRSKVPGFVLEALYLTPQSLMYSAFGVVLLLVPDPRNTSKSLPQIYVTDPRPQLTMFPLCTTVYTSRNSVPTGSE